MTEKHGRDPFGEEVRGEAADWFGRMRGPDADEVRPAFEQWRASDPAHAEAYERMLQHWERTAFLRNSGLARSRDLSRVSRPAARRRYAAAACAAVVSLGALSVYVLEAPTALSAKSLHLRIVTDDGKRQVVTLDDESRLTVEAQSELELAFTARARRATLSRGRARFELPRSDPRKLVIEAGPSRIIADQSTFDVVVEPGGARVIVAKGSLEAGGTSPADSPQRHLDAGQALTIPSAGSSATVPTANADDRRPSMLSFEAEPLAIAVERFNRVSGRQVVLGDATLASKRISGAFRADDVVGFARAVAAMFGGDVVGSPSGRVTVTARSASRI